MLAGLSSSLPPLTKSSFCMIEDSSRSGVMGERFASVVCSRAPLDVRPVRSRSPTHRGEVKVRESCFPIYSSDDGCRPMNPKEPSHSLMSVDYSGGKLARKLCYVTGKYTRNRFWRSESASGALESASGALESASGALESASRSASLSAGLCLNPTLTPGLSGDGKHETAEGIHGHGGRNPPPSP